MRAFLISTLVLMAGCATASKAGGGNAPGFDAELSGYDYPFPVHQFDFESQRQQLHMAYLDERPEQWNGRTVLLFHGKNFNAAYWAPTMRGLLARGYRVIAPDQIGFGKSSKPERYQFSFAQLAHNTRALLEKLGVAKVAVVGHSMGGMLATRFALQYPDVAEQLVLANPIGLEDYSALVPYQPIDVWYRNELAQTPEKIRAYQREFYYAGEWKPAYEEQMAFLAGWTQHPDYPRVAWDAALTYDMIFTQPVVNDFPRLALPTLLIIGQRDRTALGKALAPPEVAKTMGDYPELGRKTAAAIPGAKLVELPGVGHLPMVEAFDTYFEALASFLDSAGAAGPVE